MLTGRAFFVDCDEGMVWCDSCVPAEVVHLAAGRSAPMMPIGPPSERFRVVESGELLVKPILPRKSEPKRMRARCHVCGVVQPKP